MHVPINQMRWIPIKIKIKIKGGRRSTSAYTLPILTYSVSVGKWLDWNVIEVEESLESGRKHKHFWVVETRLWWLTRSTR